VLCSVPTSRRNESSIVLENLDTSGQTKTRFFGRFTAGGIGQIFNKFNNGVISVHPSRGVWLRLAKIGLVVGRQSTVLLFTAVTHIVISKNHDWSVTHGFLIAISYDVTFYEIKSQRITGIIF